ncbi:peroxidase 2-like [Oryza brachyantha]|uniref:peroxidase 2-like n=1 Tax=Oryza brachyantha TaxID=4533 RepID=UPI001ADC82A0|nr:peroxidase 2-like [Oryza brachyantha]
MAGLCALLVAGALFVAATASMVGGVAGFYVPPPGPAAACGLKVGYYRDRCPHAEDIVRGVVGAAVLRDPGVGAGLIRMLFHDCFVEGCDASVLLDPSPANPQPEKLAPPNNPSLRGFEVIDAAKAAVEAACQGVVSCADVVAFAARDASFFLSNSRVAFQMPAGRLDGRYSNASRALDFLPPPTFNLAQLVANFAVKGLSVEDMVVLSGAHTVGRSHCSSFVPDRLAAPSDIDPSFAFTLRGQCPASPSPGNDPTVVQDAVTPNTLDSQYYKNVLAHRALFTSDASLLASPATAKMVVDNANIPGWWEDRFKEAMVKLAAVEVKTGGNGEVRRNCRAVN